MDSIAIAEEALRRIKALRIAGLDGLDEDAVFPHYGGLSIANVPPTLAALLGLDPWQGAYPPLWEPLWSTWQGRVERIVFIILDALGYLTLREALDTDATLAFHRLERAGLLAPITSVFPSTTTAATTTFATGAAPAEHGMLGYELFLREFSRTANMIYLSGRGAQQSGELARLGLDYEKFVPTPSIAQRFGQAGIPTFALLPSYILDSGLSRLQYRGAQTVPYVTSSDMWVGLRHLLTARAGRPMLVSVYWPHIDSVMHHYGSGTEMVAAEIRNVAYSLGRELLDGLAPGARKGTLLVICADHGQMRSRPRDAVKLQMYPDLAGRLLFGPTGEARAAYLYARQGEKAALLAGLRKRLSEEFAAWDSEQALASGLFGTGHPSSEALSRLGDVVVVGRQTYSLQVDGIHKPPADLPGRHGALSPAEMLAPWLAAHLEDVV